MKLEEAIKILETEAYLAERRAATGHYNAIKLGIEALKSVKYVRRNYPKILTAPLPGETEN